MAHADVSSQATEEEESNQEDDTILRRYQRQEQERRQLRRAMIYAGQGPPSDQLGWSIFSLLITPYIGVVALIFSGLSIKSRIQGRVLTTCAITSIRQIIFRQSFDHLNKHVSSIK